MMGSKNLHLHEKRKVRSIDNWLKTGKPGWKSIMRGK